MRYNFENKLVSNYPFGDIVKDESGKDMTMLKLSLIAVFQANEQYTPVDKMLRFNIGRKLLVVNEMDDKVAELTIDEVAVIKNSASYLPSAFLGQLTEFYDHPNGVMIAEAA